MKLLILGGTALLGRAVASDGLDRGHDVTCLARGSAPVPDGATFVRADRDLDDGLAPVADVTWDAVVDVSRQPGQVRRAVRDLRAHHRVFVSTGNVYAGFDSLEQSEDAPLLDPLDGDVMESMQTYGPAKVACEQAVRDAAGPATIVRSGLIGGPGDWSGRSGYWPWRFAHPTGADVLVPDALDFPVAMIDVRDLASWVVTAAEDRIDGTFNATGPTTTLGEYLEAARRAAGSSAAIRPVSLDVLAEQGIGDWMGPGSMPLWIADPDWRGFATMDTRRARDLGLVTRPLDETLADTLAYEQVRETPRSAGLSDDEERALRAALGPGRPRRMPGS